MGTSTYRVSLNGMTMSLSFKSASKAPLLPKGMSARNAHSWSGSFFAYLTVDGNTSSPSRHIANSADAVKTTGDTRLRLNDPGA